MADGTHRSTLVFVSGRQDLPSDARPSGYEKLCNFF